VNRPGFYGGSDFQAVAFALADLSADVIAFPESSLRLILRGCGSECWRCSYCPAASRYLDTTSAGTRPRSLISMPWSLAHARTAWVSKVLAFRAPRLTRRVPATLRA
jgi:hypothetical protein